MRRHGFTLIELLVVIAIIAILAAILFPVFAQAREKARQTSCISNMKQVSTGLMMYVQDYDEMFPQSEYGGGSHGPQQQWYIMIYPYVKNGDYYTDNTASYAWGNDGIYRCPSHPDRRQGQQYGLHMDLCPSNWDGGTWPANSQSAVENVASKILMVEKGRLGQYWSVPYFDSWEWDNTNGVSYDRNACVARRDNTDVQILRERDNMANNDDNWWGQGGMLPRYRHSKTTNSLFCDGHVKSIVRGQMRWFENIYIPVGQAGNWTRDGWYPY